MRLDVGDQSLQCKVERPRHGAVEEQASAGARAFRSQQDSMDTFFE
jgi:hypothetical protein